MQFKRYQIADCNETLALFTNTVRKVMPPIIPLRKLMLGCTAVMMMRTGAKVCHGTTHW